jgi:hypothetical protein
MKARLSVSMKIAAVLIAALLFYTYVGHLVPEWEVRFGGEPVAADAATEEAAPDGG